MAIENANLEKLPARLETRDGGRDYNIVDALLMCAQAIEKVADAIRDHD